MNELIAAVQNGGNIALIACAYFIFQAGQRLARIEKALEKYMQANESAEE